MGFTLTVNGREMQVDGLAPATTLLDFLRTHGYTASKQGCAEGDCGACTVVLVDLDLAGRVCYRAINSCIALLPAFAGREIVTAEGLASTGELHRVQRCLVEHGGSQCGYCTPGIVMSLLEATSRADCTTAAQVSDQLAGNLCRCTGYRPIRDAAVACLAKEEPSRSRCLPSEPRPLSHFEYNAQGHQYWRPTSLAALYRLLEAHPEARLVAGATEIGVEITKQGAEFSALISTDAVPELRRILETPAAWRIGAAVPLTDLETVLDSECFALRKMLRVFGSRQIRHRATLGGNLATASPIGDSAPVLLAFEASVVLATASSERTVALDDFFTGYRRTVLQPGEIIREIVLPRFDPASGLTRREDFLKVSKRREMDTSIVAAAFCLDMDDAGIVRQARLAFGGVAAMPLRAKAAEAAVVGKRLEETVNEVSVLLGRAFQPIDDVRGSAAFRLGLVVSLWRKFVAGETSLAQDCELTFVPSEEWMGADDTRALKHDSAIGHVTGRALYVDDAAQRRPMLEVWPVCSTHARAKLTGLDVTQARAAPGVVAVLTAADIPGLNNTGPVRHDEPLFATDEVSFHGQMIALIVGESPRVCRAAAALVQNTYEPLEAIIGLPAAIAAGSYHTEPHVLERGRVEEALEAAPERFDGELTIGGQEHFYLETQAAWAEPGEEGTIFVSSSTQHPSEIQLVVAEVLGRMRHQVVVHSPRMGGGFGGKETQGNAVAAAVALAAAKSGRPVRWQLDRDVDMTLTGKRHPFHATFSVGHDREGRVLAAMIDLVSDGGWSLDLSQAVCDRALFHLDNAYYLPAVRFSGRVARTNVTSQTAFRGFGGPQGMLVIEEIMDRIARRLGVPPETVRERNLYHGSGETNRTHYGEDLGDNRLPSIWRQVIEETGFADRRRAIEAWNAAHPMIKRGLAITPVKFGISFTMTHYNQAGALVLIYQDGSVQVNHGGTEMGQGLHAKMLGLVMREFGLEATQIRLMTTATDKVPNTSATAASSGSDLNGAAVAAACATLRERLAEVAAGMLAVEAAEIRFAGGQVVAGGKRLSFAEVCRQAHRNRVSLSATGFYKTPEIGWDWDTATGRPFYYFACGAAVAEVEVDGYTGMHRVRHVDIVHDVGDSLNPGIDRGQIEGGFVQGMGWLTREELKWAPDGRLLTHSASTYGIPAFSDAPMEMNVILLTKAAQPGVIHGSKAVGEPPLMLSISVREAIRDAVAAFGPRPEGALAGREIDLSSPATVEAIFFAVQAQRSLSLRNPSELACG